MRALDSFAGGFVAQSLTGHVRVDVNPGVLGTIFFRANIFAKIQSYMELDVIVPTFNRCRSLARSLGSLTSASAPPGLSVAVTVVDNNSSDETRATVEAAAAEFGYPLQYVFEKRQG